MQKLRVLLALILGVLIVAGLMTRYRQQPDKHIVVDPLAPVWNKLTTISERLWLKTTDAELIENPSNMPEQWGEIWWPAIVAALHPEFVTWTVSPTELASLLDGHKTFGNPDAWIVLLQRCDFWSQYCIESYEKGVLFEYMNAFPQDLQYQVKWYPRDTQEITTLQHRAALCAEELTDHETFLSFYFSIYQARGELSSQELMTLAKKLRIDGFDACLEKKSLSGVQQEMKAWRTLFGFTSLPANIFVHKATGRFVRVPWLYATKDVLSAIQLLLENK